MIRSSRWPALGCVGALLAGGLACGDEARPFVSTITEPITPPIDSTTARHDSLNIGFDTGGIPADSFEHAANAQALNTLAGMTSSWLGLDLPYALVFRGTTLTWGSFLESSYLDSLFATRCPTAVQTGLDADHHAIDSDHDGIPDRYSVTIDPACTYLDPDGRSTVTLSGAVVFADPSSSTYAWRLNAEHLVLTRRYLSTGAFVSTTWDGLETLTTDTVRSEHLLQGRQAWTWGNALRTTGRQVIVTDAHSTTIAADGWRWGQGLSASSAGTYEVQAEYRVFGGVDLNHPARNYRFTVSTPTPVYFNFQQCAAFPPILDGQVVARLDGAPNVGFSETWSACNTSTVSVFGAVPQ